MDNLSNGVLAPPPGAVAIGRSIEVDFEYRLQHQLKGHLHHAVAKGGDAEIADLTALLGYTSLPHRQRLECAALELSLEFIEEPLQSVAPLHVIAGHRVDARCA